MHQQRTRRIDLDGDEGAGQSVAQQQMHIIVSSFLLYDRHRYREELEVLSKQLPAVVNHVVPLPVGSNRGSHLQ